MEGLAKAKEFNARRYYYQGIGRFDRDAAMARGLSDLARDPPGGRRPDFSSIWLRQFEPITVSAHSIYARIIRSCGRRPSPHSPCTRGAG
jgi:hypothetical protein